jgi:hypothetical protein
MQGKNEGESFQDKVERRLGSWKGESIEKITNYVFDAFFFSSSVFLFDFSSLISFQGFSFLPSSSPDFSSFFSIPNSFLSSAICAAVVLVAIFSAAIFTSSFSAFSSFEVAKKLKIRPRPFLSAVSLIFSVILPNSLSYIWPNRVFSSQPFLSSSSIF